MLAAVPLSIVLVLAACFPCALAGAPEPWLPLSGGGFTGPAVPASPDPLVRYVWGGSANVSALQIFNMSGVSAQLVPGSAGGAWAGWQSLASATPHVVVTGAGGVMVDFGVELPAWVELDSPDLQPADAALLTLATGEYSAVDIVGGSAKAGRPVAYGSTFRLETNPQLYEGVRFGFIFMSAPPARPFTITGFRAVTQAKPVNYTGAFDSGDALLDKIFYVAAYTVRTNLEPDYMGAILEDRGDRISWAGDAHVAQATSMAVFGNFWDVKQNLAVTGKSQNGIASYTLCWIESVLDYVDATADDAVFNTFKAQMVGALTSVAAHFNSSSTLTFFGWDDRLGSGFQDASTTESQWAYRFLALHAYSRLSTALAARGDAGGAAQLAGFAAQGWGFVRGVLGAGAGWWAPLGMHAAGEAANTGDLPAADLSAILSARFSHST